MPITSTAQVLPKSDPGFHGPKIEFNAEEAFYPIHPDLEGIWYPDLVCVKKILGFCTEKKWVDNFIKFTDKQFMQWFYSNDFGFKKRERP
jgi:hypothetical protein